MSGFVRVIAALVLVGVLVAIGVGIYDAGVSAGLVEAGRSAAASGAPAPVVYYPGPYYGHGFGWGFGFFGIFLWILGFFLIFGLLRAIFGWGRWGGRGGYGGYGGWAKHGGPGERLDEWHKQAHEQPKDG
jgi:hypothetical protein